MSNYQEKYKFLKRKLKILVYEHESLTQELEKSQRKLLKVTRDNSFLLDRLLQYEKVIIPSHSPNISDATPSDSDTEPPQKRKNNAANTIVSHASSHVINQEFLDKIDSQVVEERPENGANISSDKLEEALKVAKNEESKYNFTMIKSENEAAEIDVQTPSDDAAS